MKFKKIIATLICSMFLVCGGSRLSLTKVEADDPVYTNNVGVYLYHNSFNNGYDTVVFEFDKDVFESGTASTLLDSTLGNHFYINDKTLNEYGNVKFRSDIATKKPTISIKQDSGILKFDGTDTFKVDKDTEFPNGVILEKEVNKLLIHYEGGDGSNSSSSIVDNYVSTADTYIKGMNFYNYNSSNSTNIIMIEFSGDLRGSYGYSTTILSRHLFVNGVSMYEINKSSSNSIVVNGWNQGGNGEKLMLTVKMSIFNFDGKDKFVITKGVVSPSLMELKYDYASTLIDSTFYNDFSQVKTTDTTVQALSLYPNFDGENDWLYIIFNSNICAANIVINYKDLSLLDYLVLNGKTMREIADGFKNGVTFEYTQNSKLLLRIKTSKMGNENCFNFDGNDVFEVKEGFTGTNGVSVNKTFKMQYYYDNYGGHGFYNIPEDNGTTVSIRSVSMFPNAANGNDWLYVNFIGTINNGTQNSLKDISLLNKILVNGKKFGELISLQKSDVLWADTGNQMILMMKHGGEYSFKFDNLDHFQILPDFKTQNGSSLASGFDSYYVDSKWVSSEESQELFGIYDVTESDSEIKLSISFLAGKDSPSIDESKLLLNDLTMDVVNGFDASWSVERENVLVFTIQLTNLVDGETILTIKKGFNIANGVSLQKDIRLLYLKHNDNKFVTAYNKMGDMKLIDMNFYPSLQMEKATQGIMIQFSKDLRGDYDLANEILSDHLFINNKSMRTLNEENSDAISVLGWNQGNGDKLYINVKTNLFNFDGNDLVLFTKGIVSRSEYVLDESVSFSFDITINAFIKKPVSSGEFVHLNSIEIYPNNSNGYDWVYFLFSGKITENKSNTAFDYYLYNYIIINGKTLAEIKNETNGVSVLWNPGSNVPHKILFYFKNTVDTALRLDGTDRFLVKQGMVFQNGSELEETFDKVYYNSRFVDTSTVANNHSILNSKVNDSYAEFDIRFEQANTMDEVDLDKLLLNNVPLNEIDGSIANWLNDKKTLHVVVPKNTLSESKNILTIVEGFDLGLLLYTNEDIKLEYYPDYEYWTDTDIGEFPNEKITIESLGKPRIVSEGEFVVNIKFNKDLTDVRLQGFTRDFDTLIELSRTFEPGYYYTQSIISNLVRFDIPHSALNSISVNGVKLVNMSDAYVSMYGREIMIHILGTSDHALKHIENGLTITIDKGFRSYNGGVTFESKSYVYSLVNKIWSSTKNNFISDTKEVYWRAMQ